MQLVRKEIGPFANPDIIQWAPGYLKHALGKLCVEFYAKLPRMKLTTSVILQLLADPSVVDDIIANRVNT